MKFKWQTTYFVVSCCHFPHHSGAIDTLKNRVEHAVCMWLYASCLFRPVSRSLTLEKNSMSITSLHSGGATGDEIRRQRALGHGNLQDHLTCCTHGTVRKHSDTRQGCGEFRFPITEKTSPGFSPDLERRGRSRGGGGSRGEHPLPERK